MTRVERAVLWVLFLITLSRLVREFVVENGIVLKIEIDQTLARRTEAW